MSDKNTTDGVETVVGYLNNSEESVDSKVAVIKNAVDGGSFTAEEVLSEYADSLSVSGAIYPMHETVLRDLATGVKQTMGEHTVGSLTKICHPNKLVESKNDVINQAISIYSESGKQSGEKQEEIKTLVKQAQRDGIEIKSGDVVTALKEFDSKTSSEMEPPEHSKDSVDVGVENTDLSGGIDAPTTIHSGKKYSYEITSVDEDVEKITWYVGGECIGKGESVTHTFDFKGVYTISVELSDAEGRTDHDTVEVNVKEAPGIDISLRGDEMIYTGDTVEYRAEVKLQNEELKGIVWEIDGVTAGHGKTFRNTFNEEGEYTLSATATGVSGVTTSESKKNITVTVPTGISVDLEHPDVVQEGDEESISFSIHTDNADIESVKCRVGNDVVPVEAFNEVSFSHTFESAGEYPVTVNAENNNGDTDTAVGTIDCVVKPEVELVESPDKALKNESKSYSAEFDNRLSSNWSVENASLTHVGDTHAKVQFISSTSQPATVSVTVSNDAGQTETVTKEVEVNEPVVDAKITHEPEVSEDDVVKFSVTESVVEYCEITSVQWELGNGKVIGAGEEITHEFSNPGRYEVNAFINTNENAEGNTSSEIRVQPRTDVTAVIVEKGGPSTEDAFVFDGSKSIIVNTEVEKWEWEIEGKETLTGESIQVNFDTPGQYNVELTVIGKDGDADTTTESITVEQYTDVSASIEGPEEVVVGEAVEFNAFGSEPLNTTITGYTWFLNGNPVGEGETFEQTFSRPGHFTVSIEAETATGDTDSQSTSIVVGSPSSIITPEIEIESGNTPVVGQTITITSSPTTVKNGDLKECEWVINNEKEETTNKYVNAAFEKYGENTVEMTATTFDGVTETITRDVYVSPELSDPPHVELGENSGVAEVLGASVDIYQDGSLSREDKNRVAGVLLEKATKKGVDVSKSDIEAHVIDLDIVPSNEVGVIEPSEQSGDELNREQDGNSAQTEKSSNTVDDRVSAEDFDINTEGSEDAESDLVSNIESDETGNDTIGEIDKLNENEFEVNPEGDKKIENDAEEVDTEKPDSNDSDSHGERSNAKNTESGTFDLYGDEEGVAEETSTEEQADSLLPDEENKDVWVTDDVVVYETHDGKLKENSIEGYQKMGGDEQNEGNIMEDFTGMGNQSESSTEKSKKKREPGRDLSSQDNSSLNTDAGSQQKYIDESVNAGSKQIGQEDSNKQGKTPKNPQSFSELGDVEIDEKHKEVKISPEEYDLGGSIMAMPNYAQDLIDFEYVIDENDDLIPEGVNGAGIVATNKNEFAAIARVEGRDWSIHTADKKRNIIKTYESHVLASLDTPIQIVSLPTRFDIRDHVSKVNNVLEENESESEELLMNIGRTIYPNWLENFMEQNDMKERQFYVIVPLSAKQLHEFKSSSENLGEQLAELPIIGNFFERFTEDSTEDIEKYQVLRELNTRVNRLKSSLRRMDVKVERVDSRNEAMSVIYQYYNNEKPESSVFPTGPFTGVDEESNVGGVQVDDLLSEYQPASSMEENK